MIETERSRHLGEMSSGDFSQTHEHNRAADRSPHARKRRLTSSKDRQKPDSYRQCRLHPATSSINPAHRRGAIDCWAHARRRALAVHALVAPALVETFDHLLDCDETRRHVSCGKVRQQAEYLMTERAVPVRHA
jgi:hypothetical protein